MTEPIRYTIEIHIAPGRSLRKLDRLIEGLVGPLAEELDYSDLTAYVRAQRGDHEVVTFEVPEPSCEGDPRRPAVVALRAQVVRQAAER